MNEQIIYPFRSKAIQAVALVGVSCVLAAVVCVFSVRTAKGQQPQITWSAQEKAIIAKIESLRRLPDKTRGQVTRELALQIRDLPASANKVRLAFGLATLSTEGDPGGRETLQAVTTTLASALREHPLPAANGHPPLPYIELASLVRIEHMDASLRSPELAAAMAQLAQQDQRRQQAVFTLADLQGKKWSLKDLRGKVVLVNFWATWCPPCRKEAPDLEALYRQFGGRGLVILGISDQPESKVQSFASEFGITYPLLLDPDRKITELYSVVGIPMSFLYNRKGKLVAEAMDMRTRKEFLSMLAEAGLK